MKKALISLGFCLAFGGIARADQYYCHTWLWAGELAFQNTGGGLKLLAAKIINECKASIGKADADQCIPNLTCDLLNDDGAFKSTIDVTKLFGDNP